MRSKFKNILVRSLSLKDLKHPQKHRDFINSLVKEGAPIRRIEKTNLKEQIASLKAQLEKIKKRKSIVLIAEHEGKIVARVVCELEKGRKEHVAQIGIAVKKEFRGIGLGTYLMKRLIFEAKRKLKPSPKILRLSVISENKRAIKFYKKLGFKKAAKIPHQFQYQGKLADEIVMVFYLSQKL